MSDRWQKLSDEELQGARYSLAVLRTSPAVRGRALELLDQLVHEISAEQRGRTADRLDAALEHQRELNRSAAPEGEPC